MAEQDEPEIIRAKWVMDGAKTLQEAAQMLRDKAGKLLELSEQGWELIQFVMFRTAKHHGPFGVSPNSRNSEWPVDDDYGFIEKKE